MGGNMRFKITKRFLRGFLLILCYLFAGNFSFADNNSQAVKDLAGKSSQLYADEQIRYTNGYPAIIKFIEGDKDKPLVVFVPGSSHLARIAYGFSGSDPKDFLSFWIHKKQCKPSRIPH